MFHCKLLFNQLRLPFDKTAAEDICTKFEEANEKAQADPIYYPDAIPALDSLKEMEVTFCLNTGFGAERKAEALEKRTEKNTSPRLSASQSWGSSRRSQGTTGGP